MSRFVRSSKFRHVFGDACKLEEQYLDLAISRTAWDSNKIYCNSQYLACLWEARGGGSFCVIPLSETGKVKPNIPLFAGHKSAVLDLSFNPFNDGIIASASDDAYVKVWQIPSGGLTETARDPLQNCVGHKRKVGTVNFHPSAANVLGSTAADYTVKVWDITTGASKLDIDNGHKDLIQSFAWSHNGSSFATASKDKKVRVFDPRSGACSAEVEAHSGTKGSRVTYLGDQEMLFTCGFSKMSERQLAVWDPRNMDKALKAMNIDTASGQLIPYYDNDTKLLFLGGKGDGNIRYYEILTDEKEVVFYINDFKSNIATLGFSAMPKYACDIAGCEVARIMKGHTGGVMPISFTVPRKSDLFQDDIFPDTASQDPALTADAWFGGANANPKTVSLSVDFKPKQTAVEVVVEKVEEKKDLSPVELKAENDRLEKRVAYLEAELRKLGWSG